MYNERTSTYEDGVARVYSFTIFGPAAEHALNNLRKDSHVNVFGTLLIRSFTRKDGSPGNSANITVNNIGPDLMYIDVQIIDSRSGGQGNFDGQNQGGLQGNNLGGLQGNQIQIYSPAAPRSGECSLQLIMCGGRGSQLPALASAVRRARASASMASRVEIFTRSRPSASPRAFSAASSR